MDGSMSKPFPCLDFVGVLVGLRDGVVTLEFLDGDGADAVTCDVTVTQYAANLES